VIFKGCGFFSFHEEQIETVLRQEGSALHHFQLPPEKTVTRFGARKEYVRENSQGSARAPSVLPVGYVLMPEHVHLLVSAPAMGTLSKVMQVLMSLNEEEEKRRRAHPLKTTKGAAPPLPLYGPPTRPAAGRQGWGLSNQKAETRN
jgi:hypothetical protein